MSETGGAQRIGSKAVALGAVAALGAAAIAWPHIRQNRGLKLLDGADRVFGGNRGARLAATDVAYGSARAQRLSVYVPDGPAAAPYPVLVFIHGGGWDSGAPEDYGFIGRQFARAGYVVVLAGYRLVPDGIWPNMLEDCAAALGWTQDNIGQFGGDRARVQVMGQSAGAYNAVALALDRQWLAGAGVADDFIKGVVGLSGPYDFYPFTNDAARAAFGHAPRPEQTQPIRFSRADAPPMLLLTGDRDVSVKPRNSIAMAKALNDAGGHAELAIIPGLDHTDTVVKLAAPFNRDDRVTRRVLEFLCAHGGASAPVHGAKS